MRVSKIWTLFKKDWDDIITTKYIASSLIFLPLLMVIGIPLIIYLPMLLDPTGFQNEDFGFLIDVALTSDWAQLTELQRTFIIFVEVTSIFFLLLPLILPTIIAADSFSGEKDRGTVEGLVAAPITDSELYLGKVAAAVIPTVLISWFYSIPQVLMTNYFSNQIIGYYYLPTIRYVLLVIFIVPAVTLIVTNGMIWASSRTSTTRDAQQLGSLLVLPLMVILLNFVGLALILSVVWIIIGILVMAILAFIAMKVGISLLNRERWLNSAN